MIEIFLDSIIYTWLYNSSNGWIWVPTIYHVGTNTCYFVFFYSSKIAHDVFYFVLVAQLAIAILIIILTNVNSLSRKNDKVKFNKLVDMYREREKAKQDGNKKNNAGHNAP
ncbi:MAG: hypothetical protein ACTSWN_04285 [Promethearchaeota archaeon]